MNRNTPENIADCMIPITGEFRAVVTRADGTVEDRGWLRNIVTRAGLNRIAARAVTATGNTPAYILGIGSYTTAGNPASLDSTNFGEMSRKASNTSGAAAQSREWIFLTQTWGGAADGITSKTIESAAFLDHANSGSGAVWNIVQGLNVTLADSDFLALTGRIRVGSHNLSHST